jgi:uncharacterized protein YbjT (DUF2867 family)
MPRPISVLVTGATGKQGGAVARALLDRGHDVRALTRDPSAPAARELAAHGASPVRGDFSDPASLESACQGCDAVFAMSTFEHGTAAETRQGIAIADAAERAGAKHLVYSSVAGASRRTGIPHFDSKHEVERHVATLGIPWTIVAPVFFMENWVTAFLPSVREGRLAVPLPARRKLQQVAVRDVGAFARVALERRSELEGKRVELAGDDLSGAETARTLAQVSGRKIGFREVPLEELHRTSEDSARMFEWFAEIGYQVDLAALRRDFPEVGWHDLRSWAREQDWTVLEAQRSPDRTLRR